MMHKQSIQPAIIIATILVALLCESTVGHSKQASHTTAIVTNGIECSELTSKIVKEGGSIADAAITALLCEGVTCPQSSGLGGGFVMTLFIKATNTIETLIARDSAPLAATENMFVNVTKVAGGKAIAVPGELKGFWELHQKYGKLPWGRLFDPVIELCRKGHVVSPYLAKVLKRQKRIIAESPSLSAVYVNPATGNIYKEGDYVKRVKLADTLEIIKREGVDSMYGNGTITKMLVEDIKAENGIITAEDFQQYEVRWEKPISTKLRNNKTIHSTPLPSSGSLVAFVTNVLDGFVDAGESLTSLQRLAEALKYAYAERTALGDDQFVANVGEIQDNLIDVAYALEKRNRIRDNATFNSYSHYGARFASKFDHGTANINILMENGDAISVTSTLNTYFGSKIVSAQTGIILNDSMDDFSVPDVENAFHIPPSPANFIRPQKMPMSSMCPTILLDENNDVEVLIGAAGGSKITSSVAYVLARYLYFNESIWDAVHAPRIHHQLAPMQLEYDAGLSKDILQGLTDIGHKMWRSPLGKGFSSVTAIGRKGQQLSAVYDPRRKGSTYVQ